MKLWLLSSQQAVFYSYHRLGFCTKGRDKDLVIRKEQFYNLHDVMRGFHHGRYPLGRGLWLRISKRGVRIENKQASFEFHGKSWKRYQRNIHWRIHAFLRHERQQMYRRRHASRRKHQRCSSSSPRQESVSNSNDCNQTLKRSPSSTVSQRLHSKTSFSFRNAVDGLQNSVSPTKTVSSHTDPDFEDFRSVCSIGHDD